MDTRTLLEIVRADRAVTWADPARDSRLMVYIEDGMAYLDSLIPSPADYTAPGDARRLLLAYVMYAEAQAVDDFGVNYQPDIIKFQMDAALKESGDEEG